MCSPALSSAAPRWLAGCFPPASLLLAHSALMSAAGKGAVRWRERAKCHRITGWSGWQGPLWVTQSHPLPKQGHLQQAAQDLVPVGLEYLQRRRLHSLPGMSWKMSCLSWSPKQSGTRSRAAFRVPHTVALRSSGLRGRKAPRLAPALPRAGRRSRGLAVPHVSAPRFSPWHCAKVNHSYGRAVPGLRQGEGSDCWTPLWEEPR